MVPKSRKRSFVGPAQMFIDLLQDSRSEDSCKIVEAKGVNLQMQDGEAGKYVSDSVEQAPLCKIM